MKYLALKNKHFVIIITILVFFGCRPTTYHLSEITGEQLLMDPDIPINDSIDQFVAPYREHINAVLDSVLAYTPTTITRMDGSHNSSAGNLMADIILEQTGPVFEARTGNKIDFVLLNFGGIRSIISPGNITARNAFEVMPFENSIEVVSLDGKAVRALIAYLIKSKLPHPIAGMQIILDGNDDLKAVNIQGVPFNEDKIYFVATSDYLVTGGDKMDFFKDHISRTPLDYKIRNAMIDYFAKVDTVRTQVDDRFIQIP